MDPPHTDRPVSLGPIIRIGANEIHINDPDFFTSFYSLPKLEKDDLFYSFGNGSHSMFETISVEMHRYRRRGLYPFFAKEAIERTANPIISRKTQTLLARVKRCKDTGEVLNLHDAYRALAADVIMEVTLPAEGKLLESDDLGHQHHVIGANYMRYQILSQYPGSAFGLYKYFLSAIRNMRRLEKPVNEVVKVECTKFESQTPIPERHPNALDALFKSDIQTQTAYDRSVEEVRSLLFQGTEPVARALEYATYSVLASPTILKHLQDELSSVKTASGAVSFADLESLPYLTAVIQESLRLSSPISGRLPRIAFRDSTQYGSYHIPKETVISMTPALLHRNAKVFPEPDLFNPDRWLNLKSKPDAEKKPLTQYLFAFGRGSRGCLGVFLAYQELYIILGNLFREVKRLQLYESEKAEVETDQDLFIGFTDPQRKGLRVTVR
jgi:cytochrome P450